MSSLHPFVDSTVVFSLGGGGLRRCLRPTFPSSQGVGCCQPSQPHRFVQGSDLKKLRQRPALSPVPQRFKFKAHLLLCHRRSRRFRRRALCSQSDLAPEPIQYVATEPGSTPTAATAGPISLDRPTPARSCCSQMLMSYGRGSSLIPNLHDFHGWISTVSCCAG